MPDATMAPHEAATLEVVVRTPRDVVATLRARSLRIPSDTGQVGLRPRCEATVVAVEPGLVLAWTPEGVQYLATAGGLLRCDGREASLLTPVAVAGSDAASVRAQLEEALSMPRAEIELRRAIERLETGILYELRRSGDGDAREARP
jgi:F0F1-type ATP synthase epsilon subunit